MSKLTATRSTLYCIGLLLTGVTWIDGLAGFLTYYRQWSSWYRSTYNHGMIWYRDDWIWCAFLVVTFVSWLYFIVTVIVRCGRPYSRILSNATDLIMAIILGVSSIVLLGIFSPNMVGLFSAPRMPLPGRGWWAPIRFSYAGAFAAACIIGWIMNLVWLLIALTAIVTVISYRRTNKGKGVWGKSVYELADDELDTNPEKGAVPNSGHTPLVGTQSQMSSGQYNPSLQNLPPPPAGAAQYGGQSLNAGQAQPTGEHYYDARSTPIQPASRSVADDTDSSITRPPPPTGIAT